jgi:hypothetical protein
MANDTFNTIPVSRNARKRLFRQARLGTRPTPVTPNIGDAVETIAAAAAFKDGWTSSADSFATTVRGSWADRKSY